MNLVYFITILLRGFTIHFVSAVIQSASPFIQCEYIVGDVVAWVWGRGESGMCTDRMCMCNDTQGQPEYTDVVNELNSSRL